MKMTVNVGYKNLVRCNFASGRLLNAYTLARLSRLNIVSRTARTRDLCHDARRHLSHLPPAKYGTDKTDERHCNRRRWAGPDGRAPLQRRA
jgi:hypothetical protein